MSDGLEFDLKTFSPIDVDSVVIERAIVGEGSYRSAVRLREVSAARPMSSEDTDTAASIRMNHYLTEEPDGGLRASVGVVIRDRISFGVTVPSLGGLVTERTTAPIGEEIVLSMVFDELQSTFTGFLDVLVEGEVQSFSISMPSSIGLESSSATEVRIQSTGLNHASGKIESWEMEPLSLRVGDFNGNNELDVSDLDALFTVVKDGVAIKLYDLTGDLDVTGEDIAVWVHDLANTYFGDANLDGEFNSADLVNVFTAGEYDDGVEGISTWGTGDWNADGEFDSSDLVLAFQDGGYDAGPRPAVVPEPSALGLLAAAGVGLGAGRRLRNATRPRQTFLSLARFDL
ncbi:MAG: PEP-CTERM sorting domain-containing protein [Planctomycetales bacterium]|nr:PEP-CTERM sorting domain-containing protein [Planctomycetales bacterium]